MRQVAPVPGAASPFALAKDPGQAVDVKAAKEAGPKDEVVVVGRVKDFVAGLAAFTLIDEKLDYCGHGADTMDGCETPWDYCCIANETIAANAIAVEGHAKDGSVPPMAKIPELRNLDLVAVKGRLIKDADGNSVLEASGWWRRERPNLPASIKFP